MVPQLAGRRTPGGRARPTNLAPDPRTEYDDRGYVLRTCRHLGARNRGRPGGWTGTADTLAIGPLTTTRRLCHGPEGLMEQEAAFLAAMRRAATWRLNGERLELRDADGALQVTFQAG
jgi:hypothetical protein